MLKSPCNIVAYQFILIIVSVFALDICIFWYYSFRVCKNSEILYVGEVFFYQYSVALFQILLFWSYSLSYTALFLSLQYFLSMSFSCLTLNFLCPHSYILELSFISSM